MVLWSVWLLQQISLDWKDGLEFIYTQGAEPMPFKCLSFINMCLCVCGYMKAIQKHSQAS